MVADISQDRDRLQQLFATLQFGDHLYHPYHEPYSHLPMLTTFLAVGLDQNQQCIHIFGDHVEEAVMAELRT
jgi:hypothetical protein